MADSTHLLNSKQMARFVAEGYLRFDELVPEDLNQSVKAEMDNQAIPREEAGLPLSVIWPEAAVGRVFRLPEIEGIIHSLVGPDPLYDHHAVHTVAAGHHFGQHWHADAIIDTRLHFDIQFMYFGPRHAQGNGRNADPSRKPLPTASANPTSPGTTTSWARCR